MFSSLSSSSENSTLRMQAIHGKIAREPIFNCCPQQTTDKVGAIQLLHFLLFLGPEPCSKQFTFFLRRNDPCVNFLCTFLRAGSWFPRRAVFLIVPFSAGILQGHCLQRKRSDLHVTRLHSRNRKETSHVSGRCNIATKKKNEGLLIRNLTGQKQVLFRSVMNTVLSFVTSLPLKKARSSIGAPVVLRARGPLV